MVPKDKKNRKTHPSWTDFCCSCVCSSLVAAGVAVVVASVVAVAEGDVERAWACSSPPSSVAASSSVSSKGLSGESKVRRGGDAR